MRKAHQTMQALFVTLGPGSGMRRLTLIGVVALAMLAPLVAAGSPTDAPLPARAERQGVTVSVDSDSTKAVLKAVLNPGLTMAEALRIAALPGNQGLIRKARDYGRPGSDALFAQALMAAAHRDDAIADPGKFGFAQVREHATQIQATLAKLEDPASSLLASTRARIAEFAPSGLNGHVTGYLVAGGTSGGFAFDGPAFFLNVDRFQSATLANTIMQHELFHAVQGMVRIAGNASAAETPCMATIPQGKALSQLFASLEMEGTASLIGDITAIPAGTDAESDAQRKKTLRNIGMVSRSITLLELSVHALNTGVQISYDDIYELGFYGDEVLYALGYVMARAIAAEEGKHAIAELTGRPGALFVQRYRNLKGYGKSDTMPALHAETLRTADRLAACVAGPSNVRP